MNIGPKAFLFDFSGTIVDDVEISLDAVNYVIRNIASGKDELTLGEFVEKFRMPYQDFFQQLGIPARDARRILSLFQEGYLRKLDQVVLFRDGREALKSIRMRGIQTGIVSNTPRAIIDAVLAKQTMDSSFDVTLGMEDLSKPKPSPEPIVDAARRLRRRPQEIAYVGDTEDDVQAAKTAGAITIAIWREHGHYQDRDHLISSNPMFVVNRLTEILDINWRTPP
ncbi:HAD family hydrolase [Candidatus Bathyarchaeota archaeon]|nr:HAD family hydrolase [Candidatus Bathyarchaeota archaeon]